MNKSLPGIPACLLRKFLLPQYRFVYLSVFFIVSITTARAQKTTEILWDNYGVPHVYARNTENMYYAYGWAQMHNHANLLLHLYGEARGRAAEYWGEQFITLDKTIHLFNLPEISKEHYSRQTGENKKHLDAFVKGINDYAKAHPEAIQSQVKPVLPVLATDVLSHIIRIIHFEFLASPDIGSVRREITPGSNSYAIAPSRSASGNAMLLANPHLPWGGFFLFFEAHLTAPEFNAYGVSLLGFPILNIAFNNHLGWTHTVNTIDASDRYELSLKDSGYLLDGKTEMFDKKYISLKVLQQDSTMKSVDVALLYSKHGPVMGQKKDKAYAVRVAGLENAYMPSQFHSMAKAKNWKEFETALKMQQLPMFNVVYADKKGNILYLFNGNLPKRSEGDWKFWNGAIDGTKSKYIWNSYHSYEELPKLFNPSTGFVQNANDAPWTSTYPMALKVKDFPAYMSPEVTQLRPQRAINMVKNDSSITFDELVGYKLNTGMEAADRFLDDLLAAVVQYPDTAAQRAATVLQKWDRAAETYSCGAVLFTKWYDKLTIDMLKVPWDPANPVTTPKGLKDPKGAVALLSQAAAETEKKYGSLDVAWGDVNRFKVGEHNYPANGGDAAYGIFRTMHFNDEGFAYHGDTYVAVTEFGKKLKAQVLLSYGNATQPGSKHIGDQLNMLSEKKLRPAFLEKAEILKNMEKRELLQAADK